MFELDSELSRHTEILRALEFKLKAKSTNAHFDQ